MMASSAQSVRYIMPEGYIGDVFVIHSRASGDAKVRRSRAVTYRIPGTGILSTDTPVYHGTEIMSFYYERSNGSLQRIKNQWFTTIERTPENVANDKDIGVFFPHTATLTLAPYTQSECRVEYEQFYVGTKKYLLSGYKERDIAPYLRENPANCGKMPNPRDYDNP